jgi:hypothetical protein
MDRMIERFLENLKNDIHKLLCSNTKLDSDNYRGLDSDRDTEEEVETSIRFFPDVLSRRIGGRRHNTNYPIQQLAITRNDVDYRWCCNVKDVSFIHILASLAIELGVFEEEDRGGLLIKDDYDENVLHYLMTLNIMMMHIYKF